MRTDQARPVFTTEIDVGSVAKHTGKSLPLSRNTPAEYAVAIGQPGLEARCVSTFALSDRARVFRAVFSRDGAATRAADGGFRGYRLLWTR